MLYHQDQVISGIAVIRVSGKDTTEVVKKLTGLKLPTPRLQPSENSIKMGEKS